METYLAIITTALVLTQIIRLVQNTISLHRNNVLYKKQLGDLADYELRKEDFEKQKEAYRLIVEYLRKEMEEKYYEGSYQNYDDTVYYHW
jgi:hypothetical protein